MLRHLRAGLSGFALRRATARATGAPRRGVVWLRLASALAPTFGDAHRGLVTRLRAADDRWGALSAARRCCARFPGNPDAWMLLGDACNFAFRQAEAIAAYERVLAIEERADAALAAGTLYTRAGQHADAAARFARAYAAGGGADALWRNAQALFRAGDDAAADQALVLWATQVPEGTVRLPGARAELRAVRRISPSGPAARG
jgi:tetratricopeptide (TPR) repeat protein